MRLVAAIALCAACCPAAVAQITADGSAGTVVARPGGNFAITGGTLAGRNLFHSFTDFGIPAGRTATFSGSASVQNIVSRVTGDNASQIDGTLQSTIAGANFYLINPRGVHFGAGARLDVSGSVHVASADYVSLGANDRFEALPSGASSFSSAPPAAFGFLGSTGSLTAAAASLAVPNGKTLDLGGGSITLNGTTLNALGGRLELTSPGAVSIANAQINLDSSGGLASGAMSVRGASLSMSGTSVLARNAAPEVGGAFRAVVDGDLAISGGLVQLENSGAGGAGSVLLSGARVSIGDNGSLSTGTRGGGPAGSISISGTESISVSSLFTRVASGSLMSFAGDAGAITLAAPSITVDQATVDASTAGQGRAGAITIDGGTLSVQNHARILSDTRGSGDAGALTVRASGSVSITGQGLTTGDRGGLYSRTIGFSSSGNGGTIRVETPSLHMDQTGEIQATSEQGTGRAGTIVIRAGQFTMANGARMSTTTFSSAHGGVLDVQVTGSMDISGKASNGESTGLRSNSNGSGDAGAIFVQATDLTVHDYATISSDARGTGNAGAITVLAARINVLDVGSISSSTLGPGDAGAVTLAASESLRIAGKGPGPLDLAGITSNSQGGASGNAGTITISAPTIVMDQAGAIQSVAEAGGNGGNIDVTAARLSLAGGAQITSGTFSSGRSGSITVRASESITISGDTLPFASGFYTSSQQIPGWPAPTGDAGPIRVETPSLLITRSGGITSNTDGAGKAGDITIIAGTIRLEEGGGVSASSNGPGAGGTVTVRASGDIFTVGTDADGNSSAFFTRADGRGNAGRIDISAANMYISGFSGVSSESAGRGNAGAIVLNIAGKLEVLDEGLISTQTALSSGGGITIRAGQLVYLRGGAIVTEVAKGGGNGGDITIDPEFVVLDHGFIVANAIDGNGGNITIVANNFLNQEGTITASSRTGISGNIVIRSPVVDTTGALTLLSGSFLDASRLMRESCATRAGRDASRFIAAPRGGLAMGPQAAPQNEGAPRGAPSTSSSSRILPSYCAG